jgi:hypothetical protein
MALSIAIRFIHPGGASITGEDLGVQLRHVGIVVFEGNADDLAGAALHDIVPHLTPA